MTPIDESGPEPEGDDIAAAEYVLGVLSAQERLAVARRMETDAAFARLVEAWEGHFAPFAQLYPQVHPPSSIKAALDRRLSSSAAATPRARAGIWSNLAFWRGLAVASLAGILLVSALPMLVPPTAEPKERLVASLGAEGSEVRYLAVYDENASNVSLAHVSGELIAGRDFELWMIEGKQAPVSMGVIPSGSTVRIVLTPEARRKLAAGAVLAISLEPSGGSPTGQPTGPVVATGDLRDI